MRIERAREDILEIFRSTLSAVATEELVHANLSLDNDTLTVAGQRHHIEPDARLIVIAIGKGALGMARGAEAALASRIDGGIVVTKRGIPMDEQLPSLLPVMESSHPVPDDLSIEAGTRILGAVEPLTDGDIVIALISGGGSSLVEAPADGLGLHDIAQATDTLLRAGADIRALNAVRRHLSRIKAGGLARAASPARVINLIISDVLGSPLPVIASGPTVDPGVVDPNALSVARRPEVWDQLPEAVRSRLDDPSQQDDGPLKNVVQTEVLADADTAADAAAGAARRLGYEPVILGTRFEGEAREFAGFWSEVARCAHAGNGVAQPPACLIGAGELIVTVRGNGRGGRNTEMAVAAALAIAGIENLAIASLATDGDDGTTGATGGIVVGDSLIVAQEAGLNPSLLLAENNSAPFLEAVDGLVITGPSGTNVNDLYVALIT